MNPPPHDHVIRAFIAVAAPSALTQTISRLQRDWQRAMGSDLVRWTRPEHLHLTLRFLGDVEARCVPDLGVALCAAAVGVRPFRLTLGEAGCFPSSRKPSVLWIGLAGELTILGELQKRIQVLTAPFAGHSENREFHPHLTIGRARARGAENRRIGEASERLRLEASSEWLVTEMELIQSTLSPQGSVYSRLARVPLGTEGMRIGTEPQL